MKKNRFNLRSIFLKARIFPLKAVIFIIVIIIAAYFFLSYIFGIFLNSDYFRVKNIMLGREKVSEDFSYLKGRNIFDIDLKRQAAYLLQAYPDYQKVRIVKILPDCLFIDFLRRQPIALVKLYRYFYVGQDMILFAAPAEAQLPDLPVILGLDAKIFGPKIGKRYNIPELKVAIELLDAFKSRNYLKNYKIRSIDVFSLRNISFMLGDNLEVKISSESVKDKMNILASLLRQMRQDVGNIKYIDLRFQEPVIKFIQDAK